MAPIRVLIADDHLFYREGLRVMLGAVPEIQLVGEAATGDEAIERALALEPDVVLMDLKMPGATGIEATRRILRERPNIGVLVLTMFDDDSVFAAMQAGARGYLLKDARLEDVVRAIDAVGRGEAIFSPSIAQRLLSYFATNRPAAVTFPELTEREREILALIAHGRTNEQIAEQLVVSIKTVRNHVSTIFSKLQVADRAQAVVRAREAGLGQGRRTGPEGSSAVAGAGNRWCGLAGTAGGALLMLSYAVLIVRQALDWQAGPTLGTSIHLPLMRTISTALLLLIVGLVGLLAARSNQLGWAAAAGGLLALGGFALWAYAAAGNFVPLPLPPWWHPLLFPALVALGSLAFGLGLARSRAMPRAAAVLVGIFGIVGMLLLTTTDLAEEVLRRSLWAAAYPLVRFGGFVAMLGYGGGWMWLGYGLWRPRDDK